MSPKSKSSISPNLLLAALPAKSLASWFDGLERVELKLRKPISNPDQTIDDVYLPESGMISLVQSLADGISIEVGLIGKEGFYGAPLLLGARSSPMEAMVQREGSALKVPAAAFIKAWRTTTRSERRLARPDIRVGCRCSIRLPTADICRKAAPQRKGRSHGHRSTVCSCRGKARQ